MSSDALNFALHSLLGTLANSKVTYHLVQSLFALHYLLWTLTNSKVTYHLVQSLFALHYLLWMITNSKVAYYPVKSVFAPYSLLWVDAFESRKQTLLSFTFVCRRPHQNFAHLKNHKTSQKNEKQSRL